MKILTTLASLSLFAAPVNAQSLPLWSTKVASSMCTYFALDVSFNVAAKQAYDDNDHWSPEMDKAHARGLLGKTIVAALQRQCPDLYRNAKRT